MLRAVIFDFDGVITDSETMHFNAFNESLQPYGYQISKEGYYGKYLGLTDLDLIDQLINEKLIGASTDRAGELAERKKQIFNEMIENDSNIIEGVEGFLQLLKDNSIAIAIYSGALLCEIELILDKTDMRGYFETIVSADQITKGKPNPEGFLLAMERLNSKRSEAIEAGQCVVIEDSRWGLEAAEAAKMHPVAVTTSYSADELKPAEAIVDNLRELTLEQLNEICR
ncbi:MAG: HAD family phosphatase [Phycisphaerales bacterium]|jgi:beta-phosphoglucomutase